MDIRTLFLVATALGVGPALADPMAFDLPLAGLRFAAELPADDAAWQATPVSDAAGTFDVLVRQGGTPFTLAVAVASDCKSGFARFQRRAGLAAATRPAWFGARYLPQGTQDVDLPRDVTTDVVCADGPGRALVVVASYAGRPEQVGAGPAALVDAMAAAFADPAAAPVAFASPGGPVPPPTSSVLARLRFMVDPDAAQATVAAKSGTFQVPAGTVVIVALDETLSSKSAKKGQALAARVADDVLIDDAVVIAKGAKVEGEVLDASSAGIGGSGGKLRFELTATVAVDGQRVALDYKADRKGKSEGGYSFFTGINLGSGDQYEIAAGAPLEARTSGALSVEVK